jgi:hypothetical protein
MYSRILQINGWLCPVVPDSFLLSAFLAASTLSAWLFFSPNAYRLLDRHEVLKGRKGRCKKRKRSTQNSHRRRGSTGRIIVLFSLAKDGAARPAGSRFKDSQALGSYRNWRRHRERSSGRVLDPE